MKKVIFLFIATVSLANFCYAQANTPNTSAKQYPQQIQCDSTWYPFHFISLAEAEKILLRPVFLKDSLCSYKNGYFRYNFTYKATIVDSMTPQLRASLFFSLEQHPQVNGAKNVYNHIKAENQQSGNFTDLNGMGDEGFVTKDVENNPFIMIRQNNRIYKLRPLHVTDKTSSYDALMQVAKKIVAEH